MKAWIVKDFDDVLRYFTFRPLKDEYHGKWYSHFGSTDIIKEGDLPKDVNPQWEDKEPIEVVFKFEKA